MWNVLLSTSDTSIKYNCSLGFESRIVCYNRPILMYLVLDGPGHYVALNSVLE